MIYNENNILRHNQGKFRSQTSDNMDTEMQRRKSEVKVREEHRREEQVIESHKKEDVGAPK